MSSIFQKIPGFAKISTLSFQKIQERRADHRAVAAVFGENTVHGKHFAQPGKDGFGKRHAGKIAGKDDIFGIEFFGGENAHHTDGFKHEIDDPQRQILFFCQIGKLPEVGGGGIGVERGA